MGLDEPGPGNSVFHFRFDVSLQVVGGVAPAAMPLPPGPRNCAQSVAASAGSGAARRQTGNTASASAENESETTFFTRSV